MAVRRRRTIKRGPNKGDTIIAQAASAADMRRGNWHPTRVVKDVGSRSTLRDNPGVKFGSGGKKKGRKKKSSRKRMR
jgi:hypothetical protein